MTLESKLLKLSSVTFCMRLSCTIDNEFSLLEVKSCSVIYFSVKRRVLCSMCTNSSGRVDGSTPKIQERTGAFPSGSLNVNASVTAEIPVRANSPLGEAPHSLFILICCCHGSVDMTTGNPKQEDPESGKRMTGEGKNIER